MTLSLLSSLLLLGSAAADRNNIFGRSVHKRSSPLKRIRRAERKTSLVTEEVTTIKAPRILTEDGPNFLRARGGDVGIFNVRHFHLQIIQTSEG